MIFNNNDYVSYRLALALKRAGFDEPCDHYYCVLDNETDVRFWSIHPAESQNRFTYQDNKRIADAPSLWHAQKWLREKKNIDVLILNCACGYVWDVSKAGDERTHGTSLIAYDDKGNDPNSGCWLSYESALSAGIAAAVDYLLKINQ